MYKVNRNNLIGMVTRFLADAIADLHTFQFTFAHELGFSVSTSRLLATDLNTETTLQITH
jgi:hypothetical protein